MENDLTGSQENEAPEDFGIDEAQLQQDAAIGEDTEMKEANVPLRIPDDEDAGTQDDEVNDHRLSQEYPVDPTDVYGGRKTGIPKEVPLTHFKNMETGNIFPTNESIRQQRHLRPCDKDGKLVHDTRTPQDLR